MSENSQNKNQNEPQEFDETEKSSLFNSSEIAAKKRFIRNRVKRLYQSSWRRKIKKHAFPIMTVILLLIIFITFRKILLPFIFAVIVVYLMEPIVKRLSTPWGKSNFKLPRWLSVIIVYLCFLSFISLSAFMIVPQLLDEGVRVVRTFPNTFSKIRKDQLPELDKKIQTYVQEYLPQHTSETNFSIARRTVEKARKVSLVASMDFAHQAEQQRKAEEAERKRKAEERLSAQDRVDRALKVANDQANQRQAAEAKSQDRPAVSESEMQSMIGTTTGWYYSLAGRDSGVRIRRSKSGELELLTTDFEIEVEERDKHHWLVRNNAMRPVEVVDNTPQIISLQTLLDDAINDFSSFSNKRITSLFQFLKKIVVGVVGLFVATILTLMVAAFMSIDLPRVMGYIRLLVPAEGRAGYDVLLKRIDHGVSGVIRGQLLICLINGMLTYIGLHLLEIDFALLLAVIAGTLSLVPVFGTIISTVPIVLFSLSDGPVKALLALGWILLIHFIEANVLNPKIIGKSAEIHPVIVIFALLAGESAFGIIGALLAVPVASIFLTFYEFLRTTAWKTEEERRAQAKVEEEQLAYEVERTTEEVCAAEDVVDPGIEEEIEEIISGDKVDCDDAG